MTGFSNSASPIDYAGEKRSFLNRVFTLMGIGLLGSFAAAWLTYQSGWAGNQEHANILPLLIGLAPLGIIIYLGFRMQRLSAFAAHVWYGLFCLTNGIGLSYIFIAYDIGSIQQAFAAAGATFLAAAAYGATTKRDLSSLGGILTMALLGLIVASIINIFFASSALYWIVTYAGIAIFIGLTAYDMNKVVKRNRLGNAGTADDAKEAIWGAIELYLDFVNLLLLFLRIFGRRD